MSSLDPARSIWSTFGLPEQALEQLHLSPDPDPAVDSHFMLGTAAQVSPSVHTSGIFILATVSTDFYRTVGSRCCPIS